MTALDKLLAMENEREKRIKRIADLFEQVEREEGERIGKALIEKMRNGMLGYAEEIEHDAGYDTSYDAMCKQADKHDNSLYEAILLLMKQELWVYHLPQEVLNLFRELNIDAQTDGNAAEDGMRTTERAIRNNAIEYVINVFNESDSCNKEKEKEDDNGTDGDEDIDESKFFCGLQECLVNGLRTFGFNNDSDKLWEFINDLESALDLFAQEEVIINDYSFYINSYYGYNYENLHIFTFDMTGDIIRIKKGGFIQGKDGGSYTEWNYCFYPGGHSNIPSATDANIFDEIDSMLNTEPAEVHIDAPFTCYDSIGHVPMDENLLPPVNDEEWANEHDKIEKAEKSFEMEGLDEDGCKDNNQEDDSIRAYLMDIYRFPYLQLEDEMELLKRIDKGKQADLVKDKRINADNPAKLKNRRELNSTFKQLDKLLAAERTVMDKRSIAVAFRKFDVMRKNGCVYTLFDFEADTSGFTKSDRCRFLDILREEEVDCWWWINYCSKSPFNDEPEPRNLDLIKVKIEQVEEWLAGQIQSGAKKGRNKKFDNGTDKERITKAKHDFSKLLKNIKNQSEEAKCYISHVNLELVVLVAKQYIGRGLTFLDLVQEGSMGLIKAVEKYDYTKDFKFTTYAAWWIRKSIIRALVNKTKTIQLPGYMIETVNKLVRVSRLLLQELGREPTTKEIAELMETTEDRVLEIMKIAQEPVSLEAPFGDEEDIRLGDTIEDYNVSSPLDIASLALLREKLNEVLGTLSDREREVLELRFGLKDGQQRTLAEVGQHLGVTRERIRQIEAKALRRLRGRRDLFKYHLT